MGEEGPVGNISVTKTCCRDDIGNLEEGHFNTLRHLDRGGGVLSVIKPVETRTMMIYARSSSSPKKALTRRSMR